MGPRPPIPYQPRSPIGDGDRLVSNPERDRRILLACLRLAASGHDGEALQALRKAQRIMASRQMALADAVELALELDASVDRLWIGMHVAERIRLVRREGAAPRLVITEFPDTVFRAALRRMVLDGP